MDLLKNMGFNPELLDEKDLEALETIGKKFEGKIGSDRIDPNQVMSEFRKNGIDIDKLINKMRDKKPQKVSTRKGRNEKCDCGSGKKYKKCCG